MDSDNNASSATVTVNSGAVWNMTGNSYVKTLTNNGTINRNGYTLSYSSLSGSGTITETTGITSAKSEEIKVKSDFTLDGRKADAAYKGIVIQDGKKRINK